MTPEYRINTEKRIKEYFDKFDDIQDIINIKSSNPQLSSSASFLRLNVLSSLN